MFESFPGPIDAQTRFCAVLGQPVRHSASPAMQNAGIAALGLNWRYLACEVAPEALSTALRGAQALGFIGLNLTVPHKMLAFKLVDVLDVSAKAWGAVNTVCFEGLGSNGQWRPVGLLQETPIQTRAHGYNTDADAIVRSLEEDLKLHLEGCTVLLLGAGGAGRAAALRLAAAAVSELYLVNRTEPKAVAVANEIQAAYPGVKARLGYPNKRVDLLLNATSLGLKPADPSPLEPGRFELSQAAAVYDMIYRPAQTPLLAAASAAGCRTANGLGMLLYQGAKALEIWTQRPAPVGLMRQALEQNVYGTAGIDSHA